MEQSSIVGLTAWRTLSAQIGLVVVGVFSILTLFSLGGQLIVAPGLLPAQWLIAKRLDGWASSSFAVLGSLLMAEVVLIGTPLLLGDGIVAVVVGGVVGLSVATLFFKTSQARE